MRIYSLSKHFFAFAERILNHLAYTDTAKCPNCKHAMENTSSRLFLIPDMFSQAHEEGAGYYLMHAVPIRDKSEIPTGQRALYLHYWLCGSCGHKMFSVVEFLQVRDVQNTTSIMNYTYEELQELWNRQLP